MFANFATKVFLVFSFGGVGDVQPTSGLEMVGDGFNHGLRPRSDTLSPPDSVDDWHRIVWRTHPVGGGTAPEQSESLVCWEYKNSAKDND